MSMNDMTICANCGKGEDNSGHLKKCNGCMMVKYCSRDCQKAHRPQHKKACKLRAAELHEEALFKPHPPKEECPVCFLPMMVCGEVSIHFFGCDKKVCISYVTNSDVVYILVSRIAFGNLAAGRTSALDVYMEIRNCMGCILRVRFAVPRPTLNLAKKLPRGWKREWNWATPKHFI